MYDLQNNELSVSISFWVVYCSILCLAVIWQGLWKSFIYHHHPSISPSSLSPSPLASISPQHLSLSSSFTHTSPLASISPQHPSLSSPFTHTFHSTICIFGNYLLERVKLSWIFSWICLLFLSLELGHFLGMRMDVCIYHRN